MQGLEAPMRLPRARARGDRRAKDHRTDASAFSIALVLSAEPLELPSQ